MVFGIPATFADRQAAVGSSAPSAPDHCGAPGECVATGGTSLLSFRSSRGGNKMSAEADEDHESWHNESAFEGKTPVWLWWDYKAGEKYPGYMELCRKALDHFAPSSHFEIKHVNGDNIADFLQDWPEEVNNKKVYAQAISDVARAGLLAKYGGIYLDSDILVAAPLQDIVEKLHGPESVDLVTYTNGNQHCDKGAFSSNFMAAKPGNSFHTRWWAEILKRLRTPCSADAYLNTQVCCHQPSGTPYDKCHFSWGGAGERIAHPLLARLLEQEGSNFNVHCFNERDGEGFAPCGNCMWNELLEDSKELHEKSCHMADNDLKCDKGGKMSNFFGRRAYHLFSTLQPPSIRQRSAKELSENSWVMAQLVSKKMKHLKLD